MKQNHLAPLALAAAFAAPQIVHADLFLHSNFDICPGYHGPTIPIPDLTNRHVGMGYGEFSAGNLNHSLSLGSSGNRASGYSAAWYSSIAPEFNQSWYGSYINRFNVFDGGGIFLQFSPDSNLSTHENEMAISVLPMGVILNYGTEDTYVLHRTSSMVDHFVFFQYSTNGTGQSRLQLWIDPANTNDLGSPLISYDFVTMQPFNFLAASCWGGSPNDSLDELRFGTELGDVAVIPAPATTMLLAGMAASLRRRR